MMTRRVVWILLVICATIWGTPAALPAADPCNDIAIDPAARYLRTGDVARALTASAILQRVKEKRESLFVDVRGAGDFEQFRIPGSINVPLHFVKTKPFLKMKPFVLVDEGCRYKSLAEACGKLADAGFPCFVLYGGLTAWRDEGGPLEGAAGEKLGVMTASQFSREKDRESWRVIDVSHERNQRSFCLAPDAVHVPLMGTPASIISKLKAASHSHRADPFTQILIFNEKGAGYDSVRVLTGKAGLKSVFTLGGGFEQYLEYLSQLAALATPRAERLKATNGCGTSCGGNK